MEEDPVPQHSCETNCTLYVMPLCLLNTRPLTEIVSTLWFRFYFLCVCGMGWGHMLLHVCGGEMTASWESGPLLFHVGPWDLRSLTGPASKRLYPPLLATPPPLCLKMKLKPSAVSVTYLNAGVVVVLVTRTFCVVLSGLEFTILLPQPLESWDYKCESPCVTVKFYLGRKDKQKFVLEGKCWALCPVS